MKEANPVPAPAESAAPPPAPRIEAPPSRAEAPQPHEPKIDPKELLDSAGLVMIETDRSKATTAPEPEEPQHLGRPRRERPKPGDDGELQQVETKH